MPIRSIRSPPSRSCSHSGLPHWAYRSPPKMSLTSTSRRPRSARTRATRSRDRVDVEMVHDQRRAVPAGGRHQVAGLLDGLRAVHVGGAADPAAAAGRVDEGSGPGELHGDRPSGPPGGPRHERDAAGERPGFGLTVEVTVPCPHFSSRDIRRSASGLPPVWQVGQYCRLESANDTSRTMSPQTGQGLPVWPCTARWDFFSPLSSLAARPAGALDRVAEHGRGSRRTASASSSSVEAVGRLERRHPRGVQQLVGVGVADARRSCPGGAARP